MKITIIGFLVIQLGFCLQPYQSRYEDKDYCVKNWERITSQETILIINPHDEYFYKKLGMSMPIGQ